MFNSSLMAINEILSKVTDLDENLTVLEMNNSHGIALEDTAFAPIGHLDGQPQIGKVMTINGKRSHFKAESYPKLINYAKSMPDQARNVNVELNDLYKTILDKLIIRPKYTSVDGVVHVTMKITNKHILDTMPQEYSVAVGGLSSPDSFGDWTSIKASRGYLQAILPNGIVLGENYCSNEGTHKFHQSNHFLYS